MTGPVNARRSDPWVVAIWNQKGGVGKSTITMGLAAHIATSHGRALAVDIDPQASAHDLASVQDDPGYDIVHELDPGQLARMRALREFDTILVDCPGYLEEGGVLGEVLKQADYVVVPYDHEAISVAPTLRSALYATERGVPCRVLLNNLDPRLGATHAEDAWQMLADRGVPAFRTVIRKYRVWSTSLLHGVPITRYTSRYAVAAQKDIASACTELLYERGRLAKAR
jgi:chromosome partitioning protein